MSLAAIGGRLWILVAACVGGKSTAILAKTNPLVPASFRVDPVRPLLNTLMPTHTSSIDVKPFSVRINLHGDLDFFLPTRIRRKSIERSLTEKTSIKDVIESCGVPHPDVGLILLKGKALDFGYRVTGDAEINVYPPGIGYPYFGETSLQVATMLMFIADGHLGKLARTLRLLGFDVAYDCHADDRQLLTIMEAESRALLTRDRRLLMHAVVQ